MPSLIREIFERCLEVSDHERRDIINQLRFENSETHRLVSELIATHFDESIDVSMIIAKGIRRVDGDKNLDSRHEILALEQNSEFGDYIIVKSIGRGANGDVYLAYDRKLARHVALKFVAIDSPHEARVMAQLNHPHIAQVYSLNEFSVERPAGESSSTKLAAISMQYVCGANLAHIIENLSGIPAWTGRDVYHCILKFLSHYKLTDHMDLSPESILLKMTRSDFISHLGAGLSSALAFAHLKNVLHLDIKPANIMIEPSGQVRLTDFSVSVNENVGIKNARGGTFGYMAPEIRSLFQLPPSPVYFGPESDVFGFGRVLSDLESLSGLVPTTFHQIIKTCLSEDPKNRYRSGVELANSWRSTARIAEINQKLQKNQNWFLYKAAQKYPRSTILAVAILPNLVASVMQVLYNSIHIVQNLSKKDQSIFSCILGPWNFLIFAAGIGYVFYRYRNIFNSKNALKEPIVLIKSASMRRDLVSNARLLSWFTAMAWSIGFLLFVGSLSFFGDKMTTSSVGHFLVSFFLALGIPLSFGYLGLIYVNLIAYYPRFLQGSDDLETELKRDGMLSRSPLGIYPYLAGVLPLGAAIVTVILGPGLIGPNGDYPFQFLVTSFVLTGIVGFSFAGIIRDRFNQGLATIRGEF